MRIFSILTLATSLTLFYSCNNSETDNSSSVDTTKVVESETKAKPLPYDIVKTEPYETDRKAQINHTLI